MRSRRACMASERPKTMASGGISPKDWTSGLTEVVDVMDISSLSVALAALLLPLVCTPRAKLLGTRDRPRKLRLNAYCSARYKDPDELDAGTKMGRIPAGGQIEA